MVARLASQSKQQAVGLGREVFRFFSLVHLVIVLLSGLILSWPYILASDKCVQYLGGPACPEDLTVEWVPSLSRDAQCLPGR